MVQWTVESLLQHITDSDYTIQGQKTNSKSIRNVSSLHTGTRDDVSFCSSEEYRCENSVFSDSIKPFRII